jgi:hypothetical protein
MKTSENFTVYSIGIVHASVCSDLPKNKIAERMNREHPTGITSKWQVSDEDFKDGTKNGSKCPDHENNRHWLMVC